MQKLINRLLIPSHGERLSFEEKIIERGLTWRALVIGAILELVTMLFMAMVMLFFNAGAPYWDWFYCVSSVWNNGAFAWAPLLMFAIMFPTLAAVTRKFPLNRRELIVIYAMVGLANGWMLWANYLLEAPYGMTAVYPDMKNYLPPWLQLSEEAAESVTAKGPIFWNEWAMPMAWAAGVFVSMHFVVLFMFCLFRDEWIDVEHLGFPWATPGEYLIRHTEGPQGQRPTILKQKFLWLGLLVSLLWQIPNTIHMLNPSIPGNVYATAHWMGEGIGLQGVLKGEVIFHFELLNIMAYFLLPLNVLLTSWVTIIIFWWIYPAVLIGIGAIPDRATSTTSFWGSQVGSYWGSAYPLMRYNGKFTFGFLTALGIWMVLFNGRYIVGKVRQAFAKVSAVPGRISPRIYVFGLPIFLVIYFALRFAAGSDLDIIWSAAGGLLAFLWLLGCLRMRTMTWGDGSIWHHYIALDFDLVPYWGNVAATNTPSKFVNGMIPLTTDSFPPGSHLAVVDSFGLNARLGGDDKELLKAIIISIIIGVLAMPMYLAIVHSYTGFGYYYPFCRDEGIGYVRTEVLAGGGAQYGGTPADYINDLIFGLAFSGILVFMQRTFAWWPFEVTGFVLGGWQLQAGEFLTMFTPWIWKYLTFRIGGVKLYEKKMLPFAIGAIIGVFAYYSLIEWPVGFFIVGMRNIPPLA